MIPDLNRGGVTFIQVRHDSWCRAQITQRASDCCCNSEAVVVDQQTWTAGVEQGNRKARRMAEREARRKAKKQ